MHFIRQSFGWVGSVSFAICAVPQVYHTWSTHDTTGLSLMFILLWFIGELFSAIYLLWDDYSNGTRHHPIYLNYVINGVCVIYLLYALWTY